MLKSQNDDLGSFWSTIFILYTFKVNKTKCKIKQTWMELNAFCF